MEVLKADTLGFCFGVKRAIERLLKEAMRRGKPIYTLGPVIHNPQMVEELKSKGIYPVKDIAELKDGIVAFRTHGIKKEEEEYIKQKGLSIIDVTCPYVKQVRKKAIFLKRNGYKVVIIGDKDHPEVKSVLSYLDNDGIVLDNPFFVKEKRLGVVSQTTQDKGTLYNVVMGLLSGVEELRLYNTICKSTELRQRDAFELSSKVDAMVIIGGKDSANTRRLYSIAKQVNPNTYHIETEEEIMPEWFSGLNKVGITAGASTPGYLIDQVERRLKNL